jgi:hypothetical protein
MGIETVDVLGPEAGKEMDLSTIRPEPPSMGSRNRREASAGAVSMIR